MYYSEVETITERQMGIRRHHGNELGKLGPGAEFTNTWVRSMGA